MPIIISKAAYFGRIASTNWKRCGKMRERKRKITHQNGKNKQQNPFYLNALILYDDNDDHMGVRARKLTHIHAHKS